MVHDNLDRQLVISSTPPKNEKELPFNEFQAPSYLFGRDNEFPSDLCAPPHPACYTLR